MENPAVQLRKDHNHLILHYLQKYNIQPSLVVYFLHMIQRLHHTGQQLKIFISHLYCHKYQESWL